MWHKTQAELLRQEIDIVISSLPDVAGLQLIIKEPLKQQRRGLAVETADSQPWSLLPMLVCESLCGHYEQAIPIAAARQFLVAAADVFDDVEDSDSSFSLPARYGQAIATNVATTLVILAEKAMTRLNKTGVANNVIVEAMDLTNSYYSTACAGQHLDLSFTFDAPNLEDEYLKIASMKSASQIQWACHVGALVADASEESINALSEFGQNLGMASQIANDIQGVIDGSDIGKPKITLPIIFGLTQADKRVRHQTEVLFSSKNIFQPKEIVDALFECGAIHYSMIKVEFYKEQARDNLIDAEQFGVNVERLKLFLE